MKKQWKLLPADNAAIQSLQESLQIHPIFCRLLVQRGITNYEAAKQFFRPTLEDLHDPFLMKDMAFAVQRLHQAIQNKERILLYGDYDIDGTTSVAMMHAFLEKHHRALGFYIPDRYKEGYGISMEGIEYAATKNVKLIIAMDCGIKATRQADRANMHGIDLIICDHHLPDKLLPAALAVLDPKREDCAYPYKELSGCGVAFKLIQAYCQQYALSEENWKDLLEFLVISIAGDIVPITGENRILAHFGLRQLNQTKRLGIQALIEYSKRETPLTISDIVFGLGPQINAAGRLADAAQAVKLLIAKTKESAFENARVLDSRNKVRKEFDQRMAEEAIDLFMETPNWEERKSIVLYQAHWHKGIVGIVASRVVEHYNRPTIILTQSGNFAVGSARSVRGFDIHAAIQQCEKFLLNFGGHKYAAGLTMKEENIEVFRNYFEAVVSTNIHEDLLVPEVDISAVLDFKSIKSEFWEVLQEFAPFGPSNRNPVFASKNVKDVGYSRILKNKHLKLTLKQDKSPVLNGIAFNKSEHFPKIVTKSPFHICYTIQENRWKDQSHLQLMVKDMRFPEEWKNGE